MRDKISRIANDTFLSLTFKLALVCGLLYIYRFTTSEFDINFLIRIGFYFTYPIIIFFFGRQGAFFCFVIFANFLALTMDYLNYTSFIIITVLSMLMPKSKNVLLINYFIDMMIVATLHDKTPIHCLIHFCNCTVFYYALNFMLTPNNRKKKLELTVDETIIIEELLKGKQQKEIEQFSQNTVTNKLKAAKKRNEIATTDELLSRFREEFVNSK